MENHLYYSQLLLIRMYLRPQFRDVQSNIIRLIRISHYSYHFIGSLAIRSRRIPLIYMDVTRGYVYLGS